MPARFRIGSSIRQFLNMVFEPSAKDSADPEVKIEQEASLRHFTGDQVSLNGVTDADQWQVPSLPVPVLDAQTKVFNFKIVVYTVLGPFPPLS